MRIRGGRIAGPGAVGRSHRGQSLVEFALTLPLLLVLLLGVADFGRVFAAGITLEAASRNAAEAAAQEYIQISRTQGALAADDYNHLHELALEEVCNEAKVLPNRMVDGSGGCTMPIIAVCVHDNAAGDAGCGTANAPVPSECGEIASWATAADPGNIAPVSNGSPALPYVEVRTCYHFTTLFNLHLSLPMGAGLSLGDVWLQRDRTFVVGDY
jgi:TadE-like protein